VSRHSRFLLGAMFLAAAYGGGCGPSGDSVPAGVECPARSGYFACGATACSRSLHTCLQGTCEWTGGLAPECSPCPTCECLRASASLGVTDCQDDGEGGLTIALSSGTAAASCQPAGTVGQGDGSDCCSGWAVSGECTAQAGSPCSTSVVDCYGGTCTAGTCACIGPSGYCSADSDCCSGASRCVDNLCR
jgi:hypothetical protein